MNKIMKGSLNAVIWAADLLCTPATLVIGIRYAANSRMTKVVDETLDEVEFAKKLIGDESRLTDEQRDEIIKILANHYIKRVLGKVYFTYKLREFQVMKLDSKFWKKYLDWSKEEAEDYIKFIF